MAEKNSVSVFFGIPKKFFDSAIELNKKNILAENILCEFEVFSELKPSWLKEKERVQVFFPKIFKNNSTGEILANFLINGKSFPAIVRKENRFVFNFDPNESIDFLRNEKYFSGFKAPIYTKLPFHYHKIPGRTKLLKLVSNPKISKNRFPAWPIEKSVELLREIALKAVQSRFGSKAKPKSFWPKEKDFSLILTHDVDTAKGFENIKLFSELEQSFGFTSTFNTVSDNYKIDFHFLNELKGKGFEIGWHDSKHDSKIAFLNEKDLRDRLNKSQAFRKEFDVKGFRSPSLLTSSALFEVISQNFLYDSSVPDSSVFIPGSKNFSGCCSVFPFKKDGLIELPLTMPMDCDLQFLRLNEKQIFNCWIEKMKWIKSVKGLAVINTHPDSHYSGNQKMLKLYENFLDYAKSQKNCWIANAKEVAIHSLQRYDLKI